MVVEIIVNPPIGLFDEPLEIQVTGLDAFQAITLRSSTMRKIRLIAIAHYMTNSSGEVNLKTSTSVGGSFTGVEPNGLLWALAPPDGSHGDIDKSGLRPVIVQISLFKGHLTNEAIDHACSLCDADVVRNFIGEDVQKIPVKEGRIRATLFVPKIISGRLPGIVWINGYDGGIKEQPAAMLASRGFITLAVAHSKYDDLPKTLLLADLDYFEEAVVFLHRQKNVSSVGVFGFSQGGTIAIAMAGCPIPFLRCVVSYTSPLAYIAGPIKYKGKVWKQAEQDYSKSLMSNGVTTVPGLVRTPSSENIEEFMPPFWKSEIPILHVLAEDDGFSYSNEIQKTTQAILPPNRKAPYDIISFPGAGHVIYPPYHPITRVWCLKMYGNTLLLNLGGVAQEHARAQEKAWDALQRFFRKHLSDQPKL